MTLGDNFSNITDMNEVLDLISNERNQIHSNRSLEDEINVLMNLYETNSIEPEDL
jgi:predicted  nucleic acid-binding Zn-ribbon protein